MNEDKTMFLIPAFAPIIIALGIWLFDSQTAMIIVCSIGLAVHILALHYIGGLKILPILIGIGGVVLAEFVFDFNFWGICITMVALSVIGWVMSSFVSYRQENDYNCRKKAMEEQKALLMAEADADEDIQRQVAETKGNWLKKDMKAKHLKRLYVEQRMGERLKVSYPHDTTFSQLGTELLWTELSLVASAVYTTAVVIIGFCYWATYEYIEETLDLLF